MRGSEVVFASPYRVAQCGTQDVGLEQVVAHRGKGALRIFRHRGGDIGLLPESDDPGVAVRADDAELARETDRHLQSRHGRIGLPGCVEVDHLPYADCAAIGVPNEDSGETVLLLIPVSMPLP
jgi:hypothetical protein